MAQPHLPRLALWIVERATPARDRDAVVGDLIEGFHHAARSDARAARRWCRRQAVRSLVPGLRRRYRDAAGVAAAPQAPHAPQGRVSMISFVNDLRFGFRLLRHQPLMAGAGMLSLAVGLGLNVLLFTLANAILLRPLPLDGADRLVMVQKQRETGIARDFSYPAFDHLRREAADVFDTVAAYGSTSAAARGAAGVTTTLDGEWVSGNLMSELGVPIERGRALAPPDDHPGAEPAVVVSSAFWRRRFGDAPLAGQTLTLNEKPLTIVGVVHRSFRGMELGRETGFWAPIAQMATIEGRDLRNRPTTSWLSVIARMKPGVTSQAAQARLVPISTAFFGPLGGPPHVLVLADGFQGGSSLPARLADPLRLLLMASLFVLVIAAVNVANLQLARAAARRGEFAVRAALGAGRARMVSLLFADAVMLTAPAGLAAIGAAVLLKERAAALIARFGQPVALDLPIDARVAAAALALTVLAALIVGGISAYLTVRRPPALDMGAAGRAAVGGGSRVQRALIVAQFAMSMALVAGAALLTRTVGELRGADMGFARNVALVDLSLDAEGYDTPADVHRYFETARTRAAAIPGVEAAAVATIMPLDYGGSRATVGIPGYVPAPGEDMELNTNRVSAGYFELMRIPVLAGRVFDARDAAGQPPRMVINETMAKRYFKDGNAVGHLIRLGETPNEVIGVVADVRYRMVREEPRPTFYRSFDQAPIPFGALHVRTAGDPDARLGEIERAVASVDPRVPVSRALSLERQLDRNIADERMARSIALVLGAAALVLAATGLYATMAFSVRRRTREIGVRMALGARAADVSFMVVRQGLLLVAAGTLLGLAGALWAGRAIRSQLYGVSPADPISLAGAALILAASAVVACWLPARRATRVDPVTALRDQ
ncbi:MAG TPA: ADOP family duplicated permease [Vicinamibacterales bacterium]|nr:ADOP family duplicated permease [Vicinamibacterales bacterium]